MCTMAIDVKNLTIRHYPDPILREKASEVDPSDEDVQAVAARMIDMMFEANGAGLAAPQVGLPWRLFVTRDPEDEEGALVWINPVVTALDDDALPDTEGCLSLPEIEVEVARPMRARISACGVDGERFEVESDVLARVWQHEADHLDGILIIDKMTTMERIKNRKKLKMLKKAAKAS